LHVARAFFYTKLHSTSSEFINSFGKIVFPTEIPAF
jgi:hypothetical protein